MFRVHPNRAGAFADSGTVYNPMGDIVSSCCADLDATISDSYSGTGQTWANIETTPADSAAQTDYDFHLGASGTATTDDPTFTGTAGTSNAYWAMDGGDHFEIKSYTATQSVPYHMHRTDTSKPWWFAICVYIPAGAKRGFFGNGYVSGDTGTYLWHDEAGGVWYVPCATALDSYNLTSDSITASTPTCVIVSGNNSLTTNNLKSWHNTKTGTTYSKTWTANTANPSLNFCVGAASTTTAYDQMLNGSRLYAWSCGNEVLDDTKAGLIIDEYNTRHNRTYA